jgi:chlorite dismutase
MNPSTGWGVLHLFGLVDDETDREALVAAVKEMQAADHQVVSVAMLGYKADVGFMALGPDLWRLRQFQTAVQDAGVDLVASYVSLTEVSEYAKDMPENLINNRLYPKLPPEGKLAFCFYPMSKRRGEQYNWYALPFDERKELMHAHGTTGRTFAGRVLQVVTGSAGLDDFEWGVSLFAVKPDDLKDVVYTMRFDEASSRYAEFGPFYTGMVAELPEVLDRVGIV